MRSFRAFAVALACVVARTVAAQTATVTGTVRVAGAPAARTVVYLVPREAARLPVTRDSFVIDQAELRFVPPVLVLTPGSTVLFRNSDPVMHNVFSPPRPGPGFNLGTYPPTEVRPYVFHEVGAHIILCHVHPDMAAFVVVLETPYHAVVDDAGRFAVPELPPGRYALRTWHLRRAPAEVDIDLRPGERRTVEIHIPPSARGARP